MDLFFNELSCAEIAADSVDRLIHSFVLVVKEARAQGVERIRFEKGLGDITIAPGLTLLQYCFNHSKDDDYRLLLSLSDKPYLKDEELETAFISSSFYVNVSERQVPTFGLACAFLSKSMGVGLCSSLWTSLKYQIQIVAEGSLQYDEVLCISNLSHFESPEFFDWTDHYLPDPPLICSRQIPSEKDCHLPNHHGKQELTAFAKKLLKSPYIEAVVTSVERDVMSKAPVTEYDEDKLIIRLVDNGGYAMLVRTTAKNKRQLATIAKHIRCKYC